jgi:hypothetical protein
VQFNVKYVFRKKNETSEPQIETWESKYQVQLYYILVKVHVSIQIICLPRQFASSYLLSCCCSAQSTVSTLPDEYSVQVLRSKCINEDPFNIGF